MTGGTLLRRSDRPIRGGAVDSRLVHAVALIKAHAAEVNASIADVVAVDTELGEVIAIKTLTHGAFTETL